jgi:CubicO group peptidase (beta-lactamase class C family)
MDLVLKINTRFSQGFMISLPEASLGPGRRTFGHPGARDSFGFADPDNRIGFGYVMNQKGEGVFDRSSSGRHDRGALREFVVI